MTARDSSFHAEERRRCLRRRLLFAAVGFVTLVVWLVLSPTKPTFVLKDVALLTFQASTSGAATSATLTTKLQATVATSNPNRRIGVYYDHLYAAASYRGQDITLLTSMPEVYQGHRDVVVWPPLLYAIDMPVEPHLVGPLNQDQMAGTLLLNVRVAGRVKWKVASWISGGYRLRVNCPVFITFGKSKNGTALVNYRTVQTCTVDA